jgi:SAM-dependent methyltransferase
MKRLAIKNKNTPTSYIRKPLDWFDEKRLEKLGMFFRGGRVLDLGSYNFVLKYHLGLLPKDPITTIDWVPEVLPYEDNIFDYVVMGQLLEHLEDPSKYLKEAMRVLKVGGILALSVPLNETEAGEVDGEGHHLWSFSEQDIIDLIKPYGPYEIEILKSQFIPEYKYRFPHIIGFVKKQ